MDTLTAHGLPPRPPAGLPGCGQVCGSVHTSRSFPHPALCWPSPFRSEALRSKITSFSIVVRTGEGKSRLTVVCVGKNTTISNNTRASPRAHSCTPTFAHRACLCEVCRLTHSPLTRHLQKKLSGHPNIVQFCSAASIGKEESDTGQAEFLLLTELCRGNGSRRTQVPEEGGPSQEEGLSHQQDGGPSAFYRVPGAEGSRA